MKYIIFGVLIMLVLVAGCTKMANETNENSLDDIDESIINSVENTSIEQDVDSLMIDEEDSVDIGSII